MVLAPHYWGLVRGVPPLKPKGTQINLDLFAPSAPTSQALASQAPRTAPPNYEVLVAQSCLTLCDPTDWGSQGSSVHGILQARILERVAIPPLLTLPASQMPQRCLQPVSPGSAKTPRTTLFHTPRLRSPHLPSLQKLTWSLMLAAGATQDSRDCS